ncbi:MAG TPA: hypothetical protein VKX17_26355 [Planctomycetota bacterium]|nr:hypothetical protein [Planctomycetota bacterium]
MQLKSAISLALSVVLLSAGPSAFACACQNKDGAPSTSSFAFPYAVGWASSLDTALQSAKAKNKPIAIYFAAPEEFAVIGEAPERLKKFADDHDNAVPSTLFSLPKLVTHLRALGVAEVVKVSSENSALVTKYGAEVRSIVLVAPNGERIDGFSILRGGLDKIAASAKAKLEAWQNANLAASK